MQHSAKVALITGAARRIGAAIACILHQNGYDVVVHYCQSADSAKNLVSELNALRPHSADCLKADLRECSQLRFLIEETIKNKGRLDLLVNNASAFFKTEIGTVTEETWDELLTTNLKAPFFLAQAALPHLAKNKGAIINITDIHACRPMLEYPIYSISKAGLSMMTKALARECAPDVRVNSVSPGHILWPENDNLLSNEVKEKIMKRIALQCDGDPQDIAKAVLFLAQDARYITGQDIAVDGGRLLTI